MGVLILLDHRGRHVNSFPTGAFLFKVIPSFSPSARSILSFFSTVFVSSDPSCLCFSRLTPSFFKDSDFLIKYLFLLMRSLFTLFNQCSYPVILRKILTELQVYYSLSLFFSGGFNSSFRFSSYSFPRF